MAGIVGLTEIQHTNGNSMLTVATTGDGNVKSEGGAATISLRQGLCKAWVNFNGAGTPAARDSYNQSSLTDNGTGDFTQNFSSNFGNVNYSLGWAGGQHTVTWGLYMGYSSYGLTTSSHRHNVENPADNSQDSILNTLLFIGDLA